MNTLLVATRSVHYAATMLLFGELLFLIAVARPAWQRVTPGDGDAVYRRLLAVMRWGVVASIGVVLAAVYMLRFFQRAMHNRGTAGDEETDARARELNSTESITPVQSGEKGLAVKSVVAPGRPTVPETVRAFKSRTSCRLCH